MMLKHLHFKKHKDGHDTPQSSESSRSSVNRLPLPLSTVDAAITTSSPESARDWTPRKKLITTWVISLFKFISGLASTAVVPNLPSIAAEFAITSSLLRILPLSSYFIGYTLGLLLIGPLSETFGRVGMLQASNVSFIIFNAAAGFSQNTATIIVLRVLSGFGGAGPLSLGGGILHDCYTPEERTSMISIYALPGQLSPAIGPILGAICEEYLNWRWAFWLVSIVSIFLQILCFLTVHETYAPALQRRYERAKNRREAGNSSSGLSWSGFVDVIKDAGTRLRSNAPRPLIQLATHPIVQLLALYQGLTYGLSFFLISSLDALWTGPGYNQPLILASLNYLALGAGLVFGSQITRPLNQRIGAYLIDKDSEGLRRPEHRIPMILTGSIITPIGLLWYGWSSQYLVFPLVPDLGVFVFAVGTCMILNCTSLYLVDTYKASSASATGAVNILRALSGFAFPLFSHKLFVSLGQGWGNTLLAGCSITLGAPIPYILWRWGRGLRERAGEV